jgi:hypothetical protein
MLNFYGLVIGLKAENNKDTIEFGKSIFNPRGAKQHAQNALKVGPKFFFEALTPSVKWTLGYGFYFAIKMCGSI